MEADAFRAAMRALPEPPSNSAPPHWSYWRHDLWRRAQFDDPDNFWNWPSIYHTMLTRHFPIGPELAYLQQDWGRWEKALSHLGNEEHYRNMVTQAFNLAQWERATGRRVEDLDSIYEFGGGYGALAHLARRLGFSGTYTITDLPEFVLLQRYFLWTVGVEVEHSAEPVKADLAVALYSLSETPADYRSEVCARLDAASYLVLYSEKWDKHDNHAWLRSFIAARGDKTWTVTQMLQRPDWYAIGR